MKIAHSMLERATVKYKQQQSGESIQIKVHRTERDYGGFLIKSRISKKKQFLQ